MEIRTLNSKINIISKFHKIEGYAMTFNKLNDLGEFSEIINPNSINVGVLQKSDIIVLYNNDKNQVLARATDGKGTLSFIIDNLGLWYSFFCPNTSVGNDLLFHILNENIHHILIEFSVAKNGEKWEKQNGKLIRTITKFEKINIISPCFYPVNDITIVQKKLIN